jgi:hypothetical protein
MRTARSITSGEYFGDFLILARFSIEGASSKCGAVHSALVGQHVGLEVVDDGLLDVYFGVMKLGRLHERHMRIEDHMGRFRRCA